MNDSSANQSTGHGACIVLLVALIGAFAVLAAAVVSPVVQDYLDDSAIQSNLEPAFSPTRTPSPRSAFLRTTAPMTLRAAPWGDAAIVQEIPTGSQVSPGLERAVDSSGVEWMKIQVVGGSMGWVRAPPAVEAIFES